MLSLDATVVLFAPVVVAAAVRVGTPVRAHLHATVHLANSASLLLPVSNLTNLLAYEASKLSFARFAALMALPLVVVLAVEYAGTRLCFASELRPEFWPCGSGDGTDPRRSSSSAGASRGSVLALLLGVNIGPNLTYVGSLASMLWLRVSRAGPAGARPAPRRA